MFRLSSSPVLLVLLAFALGILTLAPGSASAGGVVQTPSGPTAPALGHPKLFPPKSKPYGESYSQWAAAWWQWGLSIPTTENPFADPDGQFCHVGQSGPVFFLGSNFGGTTVRSCDVPAGKALLASPGGTLCLLHFDGETEEELRACADNAVADLTVVQADVDGVPIAHLSKYLVHTGLFGFTLPADNIAGLPAGDYQGVASGYFLVLKPLKPGEHVVHMHDEFSDGFSSDVTYNLTVNKK